LSQIARHLLGFFRKADHVQQFVATRIETAGRAQRP
jgi:hypothetical protein